MRESHTCYLKAERQTKIYALMHRKHVGRREVLTRLSVCPPSTRKNFARLGEEEAVVLSTRHL